MMARTADLACGARAARADLPRRGAVWGMLPAALLLATVGFEPTLPEVFVARLQALGAAAAGGVLGLTTTDVVVRGAAVDWPGGSVRVTPECIGVNTWMVMLAWSWLLAWIGRFGASRTIVFLLAAMGLAGASNLARVVSLTLLARSYGVPVLDGPAHDLIGVAWFALTWSVLLACWWRWQGPSAAASLRGTRRSCHSE